MWVIVRELEVFILETEDILHLRVDFHLRQRTWLAGELQLHLFQMILVDMHIPERMHELTGFQSSDLSHHHEQQGIRCDVEGYTEEGVGTALVELQAEFAVGHIELEEGVAGGKVHVLQVAHVPGIDDDATAVGVVLDGVDDLLDLVDMSALVVGP